MLIVLMVGCAAAVGLAMVSTFQPDARSPKRTSEIPTAGLRFNKPGSEPRLVVNVQKAFANEPLSLDVAVDSATGHESLMVAGLALGTRLSAGVPLSQASWQLAPRDFNGIYVYAPKDFIGIMNTAIDLLSANQRLIETRAARLEWIAKVDSSSPTKQIESGVPNAPGAQLMNSEDAALMERGRDLLKSGDVASARLLFQRLANAGIANAALVLAATYDPRYLAQHNLIGVAGDETKARDWYQRASELGSTEAARVLARTAAD
jgi:TPR repeat protein